VLDARDAGTGWDAARTENLRDVIGPPV
jgi:hypothetical protein